MKQLLFLLAVAVSLHTFAQDERYMGIIPAPVSAKKAKGDFKITPETIILTDAPDERGVKFFADYMRKSGYAYMVTDVHNIGKSPSAFKNSILLTTNFKDESKPDGYDLAVNEDHVTVSGKGAGLFYGVQSLIQLMEGQKPGYANVACGSIKDYPRFPYRGMHLDVSRHFFDTAFIKKYLDVMAAYKMNYFHWHLTDDQGWRIEIKKYPKLTSEGSKRAQTVVGKPSSTPADDMYDGTPYGGYYTQDEVKAIIKYAQDRYINIIPEIEMPGHSLAAITAYPEMSCDPSKGYKVMETWGVSNDVLCPNETTFTMLQDILGEIIDLFPCKYIHIGGDECPKDAWKKSSFCQQLIRDQRLRDEDELQSFFINRIEKFLNSRNRVIIGWDEILQGGVAPNATIMSWRGEAGGVAAAQLNHDVIMTPGNKGMYFDHAQSKSGQEPLSIGGYAPLWQVYGYDPVPAELSADQKKHVIGVQANLWTEYIPTAAKAEYMLLPRMLALSEIAWSPTANKDYYNFSESRLPHRLQKLDAAGYTYRVPEPVGVEDTLMRGSTFRIVMKSPVEGAKIHYTIDGNAPRETDLWYTDPLKIRIPEGKQVDLQTITITKTGKRSRITHTVLDNGAAK